MVFFMYEVFTRLDGRHEVEGVLMLRRGNEQGVNAGVVEQSAEVGKRLKGWDDPFHLIEAPRVNIRHGDGFRVRAAQRRLENLLAAASRSDQAEPDAVARPERRACRNQTGSCQGGCPTEHLPDELAAAGHRLPPGIIRLNIFCKGPESSR